MLMFAGSAFEVGSIFWGVVGDFDNALYCHYWNVPGRTKSDMLSSKNSKRRTKRYSD